VGGSQFSSTPSWNTLVMVTFLGGEGSVGLRVYIVLYTA